MVIAVSLHWLLLGLCLTAATCAVSAFSADDLTLYVSPSGNDGWSGRQADADQAGEDGPFASVARALEAVREARASGNVGPVTVLLRDGTHAVDEPLAITSAHGGTPEGPTIIAAYPGEHPLISGGRRITGWQPGEDGVWQVELPRVKGGAWYFRQLWVNGARRSRPRLPKEGTYALAGGAQPEKSAFRFGEGHIQAEWADRDDIEVVVLQYWTEARLHIAAIDEPNRVVTFTGGSWRPLSWSMGYYLENVAEALSEPGEWHLDPGTGILRYRPLPQEDMTQAEVVAPVSEQLVRLQGDEEAGVFVDYVALRGLGFAHCAWPLPAEGLGYPQAELPVSAAVWARGARHCAIEECEIAHCDSWGIELARGCRDSRLVRNTLHDLGAGGMKIGQPDHQGGDAGETCRTVISDNTLTDGAQSYFGGPAIWIGSSGDNTVSHNEISGSWQWAVSVGWRWSYFPPQGASGNIVEHNHIHHLGSALGSHSSIYTLGIQPGTVIRNNVVHHCKGYGIGLDQASTGIVVEDNLVYRNAHGLHFNWDCLGNIIRNNIFALNGEAQWTRYGDAPQKEDMNSNVMERNICCWEGGRLWVEPKWPNYRMVIDYNLYHDFSGGPVTFLGFPLGEWRTKGPWLDKHSVTVDPLFVDAENDDYRLQEASPAKDLGFREFSVADVGPR